LWKGSSTDQWRKRGGILVRGSRECPKYTVRLNLST
jgi:hypothetical protein